MLFIIYMLYYIYVCVCGSMGYTGIPSKWPSRENDEQPMDFGQHSTAEGLGLPSLEVLIAIEGIAGSPLRSQADDPDDCDASYTNPMPMVKRMKRLGASVLSSSSSSPPKVAA